MALGYSESWQAITRAWRGCWQNSRSNTMLLQLELFRLHERERFGVERVRPCMNSTRRKI